MILLSEQLYYYLKTPIEVCKSSILYARNAQMDEVRNLLVNPHKEERRGFNLRCANGRSGTAYWNRIGAGESRSWRSISDAPEESQWDFQRGLRNRHFATTI